jgi:hypothetical protein
MNFQLELGPLKVQIGHPIEKMAPGAVVGSADMTEQARVASGLATPLFTAAPARGIRPNPGALAVMPTEPPPADQPTGPMRFNTPYGYNLSYTPRQKAKTPFRILRDLAQVDEVFRICIETRKNQMTSLDWDVTTRDQKKGATRSKGDEQKIAEIKAFFMKPDKRRSFNDWLRLAIEEVLVVDALSIYKRRNYDDSLHALEIKDGATFVIQLDQTGDIPEPPNVAYRQIINGQYLEGGDCSTDDLIYRPRCQRTDTPYGLSPIEAVLLSVNAAISRNIFNLAYYTDGNIPEGIIDAPGDWTPEQIEEAERFLNDALAGNLTARRRLRMVPKGSGATMKQFTEPDFTTKFDEWLLKIRCAAMAVPPSEIGFTADVNKATGKQQENVVYRVGVRPLANYFQDIFDEIIASDLGAPDFRFMFAGGESEDKLIQARADQLYVNMGKVSVDELRERDGETPIGMGPYIMTSAGPVLVEEVGIPDDDPLTTDDELVPPAGAAPAAGTPPVGGQGPEGAAIGAELKKWRAAAIKDVKKHQPVRPWRPVAIPPLVHAEIAKRLDQLSTVAAVVQTFDLAESAVQKARKTTTAIRGLEKKLHAHTAKHFLKMGTAVVQHLAPEVARLPKDNGTPLEKTAADLTLDRIEAVVSKVAEGAQAPAPVHVHAPITINMPPTSDRRLVRGAQGEILGAAAVPTGTLEGTA